MRKVLFKKTPAFQFHLLQKFSDQIEHAVFSRLGGVSKKDLFIQDLTCFRIRYK